MKTNEIVHIDHQTTTSPFDYTNLNTSIQETFAAIDRFWSFAVDEILQMREQQIYLQGNYQNFEEYCQSELSAWGGYRRINQLLGAKRVIDAAGEFSQHIKNERQARTLMRLLSEPELLKLAVSYALQENPYPNESDFARAAKKVAPKPLRKRQSVKEPLVLQNQEPLVKKKVKISCLSHPRYGDEGEILAQEPNTHQQIVTFSDGEKMLVNSADLDVISVPFPRELTYPKEYTEAIAQLKEQHRTELERLADELRIGLFVEASDRAEARVQDQIQSLQNLYNQQKEQNIQLQQRMNEMEGLRQLEIENQQLQQRIRDLENAVELSHLEQWGNTSTQQATKVLNKQVKLGMEKTIDLRSLAQVPPKENADECLRLIAMALKNIGSAMNNTQALEAAAIILGSQPTPVPLTHRVEQLELLPLAVNDIRAVLTKPGCTWQEYCTVALEYEVIKLDYWAQLTLDERDLIVELERIFNERDQMIPGSIIKHTDPYCPFSVMSGKVVEDYGDEVLVAWDYLRPQPEDLYRYFKSELCLYKGS